jgi:hypothetical protein
MDGSNGDQAGKRDVKNHLLFEVATEVANRGMLPSTGKAAPDTDTLNSWWHLLGSEIESPGDNGRVWR